MGKITQGRGVCRPPAKPLLPCRTKIPPVGLEPTPLAPEASALSAELRGLASQI